MMNTPVAISTRPYLLRAIYEWCTENGFTPYIAVRVDSTVRVPHEYVNNGEIVLNVSFDATSALHMGNDFIEFKARFGGKSCDILVPVDRVLAIYARENGEGMAFPASVLDTSSSDGSAQQNAVASIRDVSESEGKSGDAKTDRVMQLVSTDPVSDDAVAADLVMRKDAKSTADTGNTKKPTLTRIK